MRAPIADSQYSYTFVGAISSMVRQTGDGQCTDDGQLLHNYSYNKADQLINTITTDVNTLAIQKQFAYDFDRAENRTLLQTNDVGLTFTANGLNQFTAQLSAGKMRFSGTVSEVATITVGGNPATVDAQGNFQGVASVATGLNTIPIVATDPSGNSKTNNDQVTVTGGPNRTLAYDLNGNLVSDGTGATYEWNARNQLIATNMSPYERSEFTYDGLGRRVKIVEKNLGTPYSTKQHVWCGGAICEECDGNITVAKEVF